MENKPMFVKIEDFKDIEEVLELVRNKIHDAKTSLSRIENLKREEEEELSVWQNEIEEAQNKILSIQERLSEN